MKGLVRAGISAVLIIVFWLAASVIDWGLTGARARPRPWREQSGKVIVCDPRGVSHFREPAEILAYGLEDPRGLVHDSAHQRVLIADGRRRALIWYSVTKNRYEPQAWAEQCPEGPCEATDQRGLALRNGAVFVAEHDRARVASYALPKEPGSPRLLGELPYYRWPIAGPSGLAFDSGTNMTFVTDDQPWPTEEGPKPVDAGAYFRWLDRKQPRLFGALYSIDDSGSVSIIDAALRRPSGVAVSPDGATLYVTEADPQETRWVRFRKASGAWARAGALATQRSLDGVIPAFQGIVVSPNSGYIYAAGPGGLHVFGPGGASIARVEFDGRVTGLAWGGDVLYLAVAHTLCRLRFS